MDTRISTAFRNPPELRYYRPERNREFLSYASCHNPLSASFESPLLLLGRISSREVEAHSGFRVFYLQEDTRPPHSEQNKESTRLSGTEIGYDDELPHQERLRDI